MPSPPRATAFKLLDAGACRAWSAVLLTVLLSAGSPATSSKPADTASGNYKHARLCPPRTDGGVQCHARVVLAEATAVEPFGEEAMRQAYVPDMTEMVAAAGASAVGRRHLQNTDGSPPYTPQNLQQVYLGGQATSQCLTIGIVDAGASPTAQSDLSYFRTFFNLGSIVLQQYDENGTTLQFTDPNGAGYVALVPAWAGEQMLDLEMASAMCPCCPLIYIGASSSAFNVMYEGIQTAVAKGAQVISLSWGSNEQDDTNLAVFDSEMYFPGVIITSSTGDDAYAGGVSYPASSAYVTAVGGTSLIMDSNSNRVSETAWTDAGSGCSAAIPKPSWQSDSGCSMRSAADVSAVAGELGQRGLGFGFYFWGCACFS